MSLLFAWITILLPTSSPLPILMQLGIGGWPVWPITTFPWSTRRVKITQWLIFSAACRIASLKRKWRRCCALSRDPGFQSKGYARQCQYSNHRESRGRKRYSPHKGLLGQDLISLPSQIHHSPSGGLEESSKGGSHPQHSGQKFEILKGRFHEGYVQSPQPQSCPGL